MSELRLLLKNKIIILWIFCCNLSCLSAAEVVVKNFKNSLISSVDWHYYNYNFNLLVTRLPGENVDELLSEYNEIACKLSKGTPPQTSGFTHQIYGLPSGVTMNIVDLRITDDPPEATIGGIRFSGGTAYMDNVTYNATSSSYSRVKGRRRVTVSSSVADGVYSYTIKATRNSRFSSKTQQLEIRTIPTITVENIDFGQLMFGETGGIITRRGRIDLQGGTPNSAIKLYLSSDVVNLTRVGAGGTIPVEVRVHPQLNQLDSSGGGSTYLEASVDTSRDVIDGSYIGDVTVTVEYN